MTIWRSGSSRSASRSRGSIRRRASSRRFRPRCRSRSTSKAHPRITILAGCRSKAQSRVTVIWARSSTARARRITSGSKVTPISSRRSIRWTRAGRSANSTPPTSASLMSCRPTRWVIGCCARCSTTARGSPRPWPGTVPMVRSRGSPGTSRSPHGGTPLPRTRCATSRSRTRSFRWVRGCGRSVRRATPIRMTGPPPPARLLQRATVTSM